MSRVVPYNALSIPELAPTLRDIAPKFAAIRRLALPGILIPEAGVDDQTAMATLQPILAACGVRVHCTIPPIWHKDGKGDQPLHIDAIPSDETSVGMVVQCTAVGGADIVLATLADPFCKELVQRNAHIDDPEKADYSLPEGTEALLNEGLIDPEVLRPDVYLGSVAAGGAIMFAFGGPNPVAHRFSTTTPERCAQGYIVPFTRLSA